MENWKTVWNNKKINTITSIQDLINANGYETSGLTPANLIQFVTTKIANKLGINPGDSVYEVGCGSGSIMYILNSLGIKVGGCDYSRSLIDIATTLDLTNDLEVLSADAINPHKKYDYVISMSVFHYFPDLDYVTMVTDLMLNKANKSIAIIDLNDENKKELYLEIRRAAEPGYDEKYKGYEHLFINKKFWLEFAKERELDLVIENQSISDYKNQEFRYNVYLKK